MIVNWTDDVIYLSGDLTQDHWNTIRTAVSLVLKRHPAGVIIDLSQIQRITPEGAETFLHMLRYVQEGKARFILANAPDHVRQTLAAVPGVRSQLPISSSVEEARASLNLLADIPAAKQGLANPVLVSLSGGDADEQALQLAAAIARARNTGIVAVYLITVPRSLPLTAPMPEEEASAKRVLTKVTEYCRQLGVQMQCRPERTREGIAGIETVAKDVDAQLIMVVMGADNSVLQERDRLIDILIEGTRCEVLVYRGPKGQS